MSLRERHLETVVGGFLAASGAAFVLLLAASIVGGGRFAPHVRYRLVLDNGTGIAAGTEVTIAGLKVGSVEDVRLTDDHQVEMVLAVEERYADHVRVDSVGGTQLTLTGKVVTLSPGEPDAMVLGDGGLLRSGHNFDVFVALEEMDLVGNLNKLEAILEDLNTLAGQLHLGDGRIPETLDQVLALISDLQAGKGSLGRLLKEEGTLDDLDRAMASVETMAGAVERAAVQVETSSDRLTEASASVVTVSSDIAEASQAMGSTARAVDRSADRLADSLGSLDGSLKELEKTLRAIQNLPLVRGQVRREEAEER